MEQETPAVFRRRGRNLQVVSERTATPAQIPTPPQPDAAIRAREAALEAALATVNAAYSILGSRALVILTGLAAAGAFAWALFDPSGLRLTAACLYAVLVFLPSLWADWRRS